VKLKHSASQSTFLLAKSFAGEIKCVILTKAAAAVINAVI
jgi:hypothetical protein